MNKEHWEQEACPKYDCRKENCKCGMKRVFLATALGDDSEDSPIAPKNGAYCNAIVVYEANGHVYIYSTEGIPTLVESGGEELEKLVEKLENGLAKEILDRQAADNSLQQEIDDIKNSPDVVDIVATYAALQAYDTSHLGNDDIIRVLADETHDGQSTYYRWNKTTSTWTYIGAVGDYYTKGQVDTLLGGKQDKLTAGANITIDANNEISATDTTYTHFTGATASTDGTQGLVPGPLAGDEGKFLKADGTWATVSGGGGLVTLSYGISTWQDFINAYNDGKIVYCRASSNSNPAVGSQTRMAFMAYINNPTTPTEVEFQYVRSVSTKSASTQSDQVYVYTLTNTNGGTWTVETRPVMVKISAGTNMTSSYSNNTLTLNAASGGVKTLSSADYNWNKDTNTAVEPYNAVALWLLPDGFYKPATDSVYICAARNGSSYFSISNFTTYVDLFCVNTVDTKKYVHLFANNTGGMNRRIQLYTIIRLDSNGDIMYPYYDALPTSAIVNDLTWTLSGSALDARQGKVLKDLIDSSAIGTTETFTKATSDWTALAASSPYTYSTTVTLATTLSASSEVELINDQLVAFANYGFGILSITGQVATIASIGQPDSSITFKIKVRG